MDAGERLLYGVRSDALPAPKPPIPLPSPRPPTPLPPPPCRWTFSKQIKRQQDEKKKQKDPNFVPEPEKLPVTDDEHMADLAAAMKVGDRCEVNPGGAPARLKSAPPPDWQRPRLRLLRAAPRGA